MVSFERKLHTGQPYPTMMKQRTVASSRPRDLVQLERLKFVAPEVSQRMPPNMHMRPTPGLSGPPFRDRS